MQAQYKANKLDGDSHWFGKDGVAVKRSQFRNGQLEGITIEYYPSGNPHLKSQYKANKLDGEMVEYGEDGKVIARVLYEEGEPVVPRPQK
jgi:antitoxin component YwqK of YwqJK toxin-antitoxin module